MCRPPKVPVCRFLTRWIHGVLLAWIICPIAGIAAEEAITEIPAPRPELPANIWPEFRGPLGNGLVTAPGRDTPVGLAVTWSETENVRWKTPIPYRGWSTPVVYGKQVWLTAATEEGHDFYALCVDAETGEIRFNERLFHCDNPEPLGNNVNGYASPSPVIESGRVYVHFGSYGTACLDTATHKTLWSRQDLPCRHYRGPGSSAILFENLLVLTFDGADVQYLAALDKETGKTVWKTDRTSVWKDLDEQGLPKREGDFRKAFSTPLAVEVGGTFQLISPSSYGAFAYEARTGREIWKIDHGCYSPAARPVFGNGLVYLITGRGKPELWAIRRWPRRRDGQPRGVEIHRPGRAGGSVAVADERPALYGQRRWPAHLPGSGHGRGGVERTPGRELRGVADLCGWTNLFFQRAGEKHRAQVRAHV